MYNKYTAAFVSPMFVTAMFAISYVQQAAAQGNQTGGEGNMTAGNMMFVLVAVN
jgi:hypothetical protein